MNYIDLESVGSTITSEGLVFPTDCSEAPETSSEADEMMGVNILEVSEEWIETLSSDDLTSLISFLDKHYQDVNYSLWRTETWSHWEETNNCYMNLEDMPGFEGTWKALGSI